ncbi:MAG: ANTAR domain-containing protein [Bryobacteraceae bacterium]|jgi:transcriptional regulator with GAF, ATPase, and Fis domain
MSSSLFLVFDRSGLDRSSASLERLFDLVLSTTHASGAFVYAADVTGTRLTLTWGSASLPLGPVGRFVVELTGEAAESLFQLRRPVDARALLDDRFEKFPEVLQFRFGRLLVAPLFHGDRLSGLLTVGRLGDGAFDAAEVDLLTALAHAAEAVVNARLAVSQGRALAARVSLLEREKGELERRLEERKLVERAKGLLQQEGATEESAYLQIRRTSRQRRVTMAVTAKEIISAHENGAVELARRMTA